ncbi:MAG: hypothetical protein J7K32_00865, partial [Deltaproteobacteria bacterium]|nr:hypothetical protein [Deltaproteobacteria bacterium]
PILEESCNLYKDRSAWLPSYQRIEIFEKAVELIKKRSLELAKTAAGEGGKPVVDSKIERVRTRSGRHRPGHARNEHREVDGC